LTVLTDAQFWNRYEQLHGKQMLVLCDTNGGALPWEVEQTSAQTAQVLGIHTHMIVECGSERIGCQKAGCWVQGTINGYEALKCPICAPHSRPGAKTGIDLLTTAPETAL
jgi:2-isopropylmalate synthase